MIEEWLQVEVLLGWNKFSSQVVVAFDDVYQFRFHFPMSLVQRYADPPVYKIMDYQYKKEIRGKDRAKAKGQKDLEMEADTVQRLMERGYRVKCKALPVGKKEADLGGYLSRLNALIENISVVKSGLRVERKQAYATLRHVKFGPSEKGGAMKLKAVGDASGVSKTATSMNY